MTNSMNESMNDRGVCRTAPATPGLLNTKIYIQGYQGRRTV